MAIARPEVPRDDGLRELFPALLRPAAAGRDERQPTAVFDERREPAQHPVAIHPVERLAQRDESESPELSRDVLGARAQPADVRASFGLRPVVRPPPASRGRCRARRLRRRGARAESTGSPDRSPGPARDSRRLEPELRAQEREHLRRVRHAEPVEGRRAGEGQRSGHAPRSLLLGQERLEARLLGRLHVGVVRVDLLATTPARTARRP